MALVVAALWLEGPAVHADPDESPGGRIVTLEHRPRGEVPILGPRHAPVTIEFFCNFGDGIATARMYQQLVELSERHPQRLRIVFRMVGAGELSSAHLEAAQEAFVQGRFFEMIDEMYGERGRSPRRSQLAEIAERAGVDGRRLKRALLDGRHAQVARRNHFYRKRRFGNRSQRTASILVNGVPHVQVRSLDQLEELYDQAYAEAKDLLDGGEPLETLYQRVLEKRIAEREEPVIGPGAVDGLGPGSRPPKVWQPASRRASELTGDARARGPEQAPVPVVFYCNFETRNCANMADKLADIAAAFPDEVRLIFRHSYDPEDRRQRAAEKLGRAALCADRQDRFWAFYDFTYREARRGRLGRLSFQDLADELELDAGRFERCLRRKSTTHQVRAHQQAVRAAGVEHTPSLVIGGRLYTGTKSFTEMAALIERELLPGLLDRLSQP